MLTVIVCLVWSGKSSTESPLASRYSVIPSTEVTLTGFSVFAAAGAFARGEGFIGGLAGAARVPAAAAKRRNDSVFRMEFMQIPYGREAARVAGGSPETRKYYSAIRAVFFRILFVIQTEIRFV